MIRKPLINLTIILTTIMLCSCDNDRPKDPWPGIDKPILNSKAVGARTINLTSTIEIDRIDLETSLSFEVSCTGINTTKTDKYVTTFKKSEVKNTIGIIEILPAQVILNVDDYSACDIRTLAFNTRKSIFENTWSNYRLSNDTLPSLSLNLSLNGKSSGLNFIYHENFQDLRFEKSGGASEIRLVCENQTYHYSSPGFNITEFDFNNFNFEKQSATPIQKCRAFTISSDDQNEIYISQTFTLKNKTPRPELVSASVAPGFESNKPVYYSQSKDFEAELLNLKVRNPYQFPLYLKFPSKDVKQLAYVYTPDYSTRPKTGSFVQEIDANYRWESQPEDEEGFIVLQPGELADLRLSFSTSFLCLYDQINGHPLRTSDDKYTEDGLFIYIEEHSVIAQLEQFQKNSDGSFTPIENDTLSYLNNYQPFQSELVKENLTEPFYKFLFIRERNYKTDRKNSELFENNLIEYPDSRFNLRYFLDFNGSIDSYIENNSCIVF